MPKKRHSTLYSKPPSTVHHISASSATAGTTSSNRNDGAASVNELLTNLRISTPKERIAPAVIAPSLPAPIRQLLDLPDNLPPRPRRRLLVDADGRRLPAGPAPPRSWLATSRWAPKSNRKHISDFRGRGEVDALPGTRFPKKGSLVDTALKQIARDWDFHAEYDIYLLANLQTRLRSLLLSYIGTFGPEGGAGAEGLETILRPVEDDFPDNFGGNEDFERLDLSGSLGRSLKFKQLRLILFPPTDEAAQVAEADVDSWEVQVASIPQAIRGPLSSLRYLSLSHPSHDVSWRKLLEFAPTVRTLTHLSLAHWPVPSLTPKSTTTTMSSPRGNVQYGATNYYSHSLDSDWSDAAAILRRLAVVLYSIEWLDLDGCNWIPALRWETAGISWKTQWLKLKIVQMRNLPPVSIIDSNGVAGKAEVLQYKKSIIEVMEVEMHIRRQRGWIDILKDDWEKYDLFMTRELKNVSVHMMEDAKERWGWLKENAEAAEDTQELERGSRDIWSDDD